MNIFQKIRHRKAFSSNLDQLNEVATLIEKNLSKIASIVIVFSDITLHEYLNEVNPDDIDFRINKINSLINEKFLRYHSLLRSIYIDNPKLYKKFKTSIASLDNFLIKLKKLIDNNISTVANSEYYDEMRATKEIEQKLITLRNSIIDFEKQMTPILEEEKPHQI